MNENIKVISFKKKQEEYLKKNCEHLKIYVYEKEWFIECIDCGVKLDPIAYILNIAKKENHYEYNAKILGEHVEELKKRTRFKCRNCGKMSTL